MKLTAIKDGFELVTESGKVIFVDSISDMESIIQVCEKADIPTGVGMTPGSKLLVTGSGEYEVSGVRLVAARVSENNFYRLVTEGLTLSVIINPPEKIPGEVSEEIENPDVLVLDIRDATSLKHVPEAIAAVEPLLVYCLITEAQFDELKRTLGSSDIAQLETATLKRKDLPLQLTIIAVIRK